MPADLATIEAGAGAVFDAAGSGDWSAASAGVRDVEGAWESYRTDDAVLVLIEPRMSGALDVLAAAVASRDAAKARQAAIDVAQSTLDLQLRYRPVTEIDLARFNLWLAQMLVDASAGDASAVNGDYFTLDYIRDRILGALNDADMTSINAQLEELQGAVADRDMSAVSEAARQMRETMPG